MNDWLNCLGNLMIISGSHNASIGNKPFADKLKTYTSNPLLRQHAEIAGLASEKKKKPYWDSYAIDRRHQKILKFALERWSFN